jgi:hypothetical protein
VEAEQMSSVEKRAQEGHPAWCAEQPVTNEELDLTFSLVISRKVDNCAVQVVRYSTSPKHCQIMLLAHGLDCLSVN